MPDISSRTLVLSQGYEPLKVISWKRAITLLTLGKCEIVEEYDEDIRSASIVLKCPSVVRLLSQFKRKKKPVKFSRINVLARDKYSCQYCGKKGKMSSLTYDHVVPRSQGGETGWNNIVTACYPCNFTKGNRTPSQAGMTLKKEPYRPDTIPAMMFRISADSNIPGEWSPYMYYHG